MNKSNDSTSSSTKPVKNSQRILTLRKLVASSVLKEGIRDITLKNKAQAERDLNRIAETGGQ